MKTQLFYKYLRIKILSKEENKIIKNLKTKFSLPFNGDVAKFNLPKEFIEVYEKTNGMTITWEDAKNKHVGGNVEFLEMKEVVKSWEGQIYEKEDLETNDMLEYFHPFDLVTPEAQCGFMITPEYTSPSIYYNKSGYTETERLELDFVGYVTMLYHSAAYYNWPLAILHILNEEESEWLEEFKANMKSLFDDFSWNDYVNKFNELRLDRKD